MPAPEGYVLTGAVVVLPRPDGRCLMLSLGNAQPSPCYCVTLDYDDLAGGTALLMFGETDERPAQWMNTVRAAVVSGA